jgi:divalent metal cation (Fe/Co/Zn/Cd) transporter
VISIAILLLVRDAAREMWYRLVDATDPQILQRIEDSVLSIQGVQGIHALRARWVGHRLNSELHIEVRGDLTLEQGHEIAQAVGQALVSALPTFGDVLVHLDPLR